MLVWLVVSLIMSARVLAGIKLSSWICESGYAVEGGCKWRGGAVGNIPVVLGWVGYMAGSAMISGLAGLPLSFVRSYRGKGRGADL